MEGYEGHGSESFAAFCERLADGKVGAWFWRTTIAELIGEQRIDGLLHVESLAADLATHGLKVETLLLALLKPWALPDCERYGYE